MDFSPDELRDLYRTMLLIRRFEERLSDLFLKGEVAGTCHLCIGQEAVPVGLAAALRADDYLTSTHGGRFIARGGDVNRIMAEIFGRESGYAHGRGGSQHMAGFDVGFLGSNGITGGGIPVATGAALAVKQKREDRIVACMMGDGAANQGVFAECLNMAALWKLPVLYVCENNLYAMSTPFREGCTTERLSDRVKGFGVRTSTVDGNDVLVVADAVEDAAAFARSGEGSVFLECMTYRFCGHSRSDQCLYRTREEETEWRARCPVETFARRLQTDGVLTADDLKVINDDVTRRIDEAEAFARSAPQADVSRLTTGVFAEREV